MRRRDFLKGALALPVAAVLPVAASADRALPITGLDLGLPGGDYTVAWRVWHDELSGVLRCDPISMRDFCAASDDAAMAS